MNDRNLSCIHHEQQLTYFCETCKEPVCNDCMVVGPHQTKNHIIIQLAEAYTNREQYIKQRIEVHLRRKKDQLVDHLRDIDTRMHDIEAQRVVLEKDVQMEFEGGIIKRLVSAKGQKLAILQKDVAQLQRTINEIDDFVQTFEYLALTEENVLPLLFMSKSFSKELMRLLSIVVAVQIDVTPYDLPRELLSLRTELANAATLREQIKFKKEVAWRARTEKLALLATQRTEFFERMDAEISEWLALVKRIVQAFDALCLVCSFCGCFLSQEIINEDCKLNIRSWEEQKFEYKCITEVMPKEKLFGTCQHHFANPLPDTLKKDKYPNFGEFYEQKVAAKEIYLKTFRTLWFSILDLKARRYLKQYNLPEIFAKYDKENTGWLTLIKFRYLLHKDLEMSVAEVDRLVNFFRDEKEDKINYSYFLNVDWYIDELQRLEEKLQQESSKYKKLYAPRRVGSRKTAVTPEKDGKAGQAPTPNPTPLPKKQDQNLHPIYPYGMRFTLQQQHQCSRTGSGSRNDPEWCHNLRGIYLPNSTRSPKEAPKMAKPKSILKQPAAPASRFQIAQSGSSHLYKYYQQ